MKRFKRVTIEVEIVDDDDDELREAAISPCPASAVEY